MDLIWVKREAIYFCGKDWTGSINLMEFEKFADWRMAVGANNRDGNERALKGARSSDTCWRLPADTADVAIAPSISIDECAP
jgi:hypothetical protein